METPDAFDFTVHKRLPASLPSLLVAIVFLIVLLAPSPRLHAGENINDQSDSEATMILTTNWWRIAGEKNPHAYIFNPDGTLTFAAVYSDNTLSLRRGYPGTWKISNGVLSFKFNSQPAGITIKLPLNAGEVHGLNSDGTPYSMTRDSQSPKIAEEAPGGSAKPAKKKRAADATADSTSAAPAPAAAPTIQVAPEVQQAAAAIVQSHHDGVAFAPDASGSAFVATIGTSSYLITNTRVAAALHGTLFKTIDGAPVKGGIESAAVGEDLYCISVPPGAKPFEFMQNVDKDAAIGDPVVVVGKSVPAPSRPAAPSSAPGGYFGTSSGGSAVTLPPDDSDTDVIVHANIGHIVGIGPRRLEIDAPLTPGDTGSPIVHIKSGKVIGIATSTPTAGADAPHYYGYRFDSVKLWQPVSRAVFDAQAAQLQRVQTLTADLDTLYGDLHDNEKKATPGRNSNPAFKYRLDQWVDSRNHSPSAADRALADAEFAAFLKSACLADITAAQRQITYDFFLRQLADQKAIRDRMAAAFVTLLRGAQL